MGEGVTMNIEKEKAEYYKSQSKKNEQNMAFYYIFS